ncbi:MAG TPA: DUF1579 domain-containing protein [Stenotrophomonas sp.]
MFASLLWCSAAMAADPPAMSPEQQAMMQAWQKAGAVGPEHARLAEQLVGTWDTRQSMWMDEKAPPQTSTGRSVQTAILGGRQIRIDFKGQFEGQPFEGTGLMGYDNAAGHYVSTWTDTMITGITVGQGSYDAAKRTYTIHNQMSDPMHPGQTTKMREVLQVIDKDHLVQEMFEPRGGKEVRTLRIEYARAH